MKKLGLISAMAILLFLLGACGHESDASNHSDRAKIASLEQENASLRGEGATNTATYEDSNDDDDDDIQVTVLNISEKSMNAQDKSEFTAAEKTIDTLPDTYHKATITMAFKNTDDETIDLSQSKISLTDDTGQLFSNDSNTHFITTGISGFLQPRQTLDGHYELISLTKPNLKNFKINFDQLVATDGDQIEDSFSINLQAN